MARPLRIEYPGGYHHVMNRGNRREDIFLTDNDRKVFLNTLADSCETYSVKLITYVLMDNHFHLLVQTPQADRIIAEVAKAGHTKAGDLRDRKTKIKDLRQMAMELCYRYSTCKQKEIGAIFGADYSTVSQSRRRLKTKIKSSRELNKQFRQILQQIENLSNTKI